MTERTSQSISSDLISESTIARIAGNLLSGHVEIYERRAQAVERAVAMARAIAAEVERTRLTSTPTQASPLSVKRLAEIQQGVDEYRAAQREWVPGVRLPLAGWTDIEWLLAEIDRLTAALAEKGNTR